MHARVEKAVAVAGWVIAAALALMLFVGPQLVAEDKAEPAQQEAAGASPYAGGTSGARPDGEALFTTSWREGQGTMPAFDDQLSEEELAAVAAFVPDSR